MYQVVIADDEPIMRKALQQLVDWTSMDCEIVFVAENGCEVLDFLQENHVDLLITDIKMPGADGIEIAKYIWENKLPVKVILLTAFADFSYAQSAIRYRVEEYVTKTGSFEDFVKAVKKVKQQLDEELKSSGLEEEAGAITGTDSKKQLVRECVSYIEAHYKENMSVADIARKAGTSVSYLSRVYKESTGETLIHTLNNRRLEEAKKYLKETDYKVYEIADSLGFENVTYFSKFFKKHTGLSPKDYKEGNTEEL